ncbi:condensin subunit ScpB [Phaeovulum vinaykumarii]|uniref:Condensin subunit ScpB n=2 Tax=Phaeovulum vinaykumarii TaxID=407234 RepID=A0A1N7L5X1_9RHOB|nr:condensin subunit ScpB [Phaeovulum vinaykumarii]SOB99613.1 condensin subunit ScpB [Phaeovulum vinaykumarii]
MSPDESPFESPFDAAEAPAFAPVEDPRERRDEPSLFTAPPLAEQERMVEAILFASAAPVTLAELDRRLPHGCDPAEALVLLRRRYEGRGVRVVRVGDAWAMRTAPDLGFLMHKEVVEERKLSRAAIETLAIIAYHQPVTRAEIEEIRGVAVSRGTIDLLLAMDWIRFGRRRMTPGRPVTFVVTPAFLDHFGLESPRDLPGLKDLRAAGLLDSRPLPGGMGGPRDEADDEGLFEPLDDDDDQSDLFES